MNLHRGGREMVASLDKHLEDGLDNIWSVVAIVVREAGFKSGQQASKRWISKQIIDAITLIGPFGYLFGTLRITISNLFVQFATFFGSPPKGGDRPGHKLGPFLNLAFSQQDFITIMTRTNVSIYLLGRP